MRNILRKDIYLINNDLQVTLANSPKNIYDKGLIYLVKLRKIK